MNFPAIFLRVYYAKLTIRVNHGDIAKSHIKLGGNVHNVYYFNGKL